MVGGTETGETTHTSTTEGVMPTVANLHIIDIMADEAAGSKDQNIAMI
jgi:hypothetical protein